MLKAGEYIKRRGLFSVYSYKSLKSMELSPAGLWWGPSGYDKAWFQECVKEREVSHIDRKQERLGLGLKYIDPLRTNQVSHES